mmetsp:Transcript_7264/g.19101  ORF Transcript_7264/g.19101 Transcript_7264/m.19101 type:complete len:207 (-) Transcript_7264:125-745(-)
MRDARNKYLTARRQLRRSSSRTERRHSTEGGLDAHRREEAERRRGHDAFLHGDDDEAAREQPERERAQRRRHGERVDAAAAAAARVQRIAQGHAPGASTRPVDVARGLQDIQRLPHPEQTTAPSRAKQKAAWAITGHESQGQTLEPSLLDLTAPYFAHGSGYVAPSRTRSADTTGAYVDARSCVEGDDGRIVPIICLVTHQELLSR